MRPVHYQVFGRITGLIMVLDGVEPSGVTQTLNDFRLARQEYLSKNAAVLPENEGVFWPKANDTSGNVLFHINHTLVGERLQPRRVRAGVSYTLLFCAIYAVPLLVSAGLYSTVRARRRRMANYYAQLLSHIDNIIKSE